MNAIGMEKQPQIATVLGPVDPDSLGITLPHEHLLIRLDWPGLYPSEVAELEEEQVTTENAHLLLEDPWEPKIMLERSGLVRDNARLNDIGTAVEELKRFQEAGGGTLVELSPIGLGIKREALPEIAERSQVQIVAGAAWYVEDALPGYVHEAPLEELTEHLELLLRGSDETGGIAAGIIGEVGTSSPLGEGEIRSLKASGRAQASTGLPISIHLAPFSEGREIPKILQILEREGVDPKCVILGHVDIARASWTNLRPAAQSGAFMELDTFGYANPSDEDRFNQLRGLVDRGLSDQLLISHDICIKTHLSKFGGFGYDHLLKTVVPRLQALGVDDSVLQMLLIDNPRRALTPVRVSP